MWKQIVISYNFNQGEFLISVFTGVFFTEAKNITVFKPGLLHNCPVGLGRRTHRLNLSQKYECPVSDTKQFNGEAPVILELWGMWSTPSLPLIPGLLWPRQSVPVRVPSMGPTELLVLNCNTWNYLTVSKRMSSGLFKNVTYEQFI